MSSRKSRALCALMLGGVCSGCIVSEPPEYDPPERSVIVLDLVNAQPLVTRTIVVPQSASGVPRPPLLCGDCSFRIPMRSEDPVNDRVNWALHANYGLPDQAFIQRGWVSSGTFQEERTIVFDLRAEDEPRLAPGCNQLTLWVGHDSSWDTVREVPDPMKAPLGYAALAVWYVNMRPEPSQANNLLNCPSPDQVEF